MISINATPEQIVKRPPRLITFRGEFTEVEQDVSEIIEAAMNAARPVTVGYFQHRKDDRNRVIMVNDPETGLRVPELVHTVRTAEVFELFVSADDRIIYRYMDRAPTDRADPARPKLGRPYIRSFTAGHVTDLTVHTRCAYRYPNPYFIKVARAHADQFGEAGTAITSLTDDAIWHMIERTHSADDVRALVTARVGA